MFPNFDALKSNVRRFVGRRFDPTLGHDILDAKGQPRKSGAFVTLYEGEYIPVTGQNIQAVRNGDLEPGDEACARLCGLR